MENTMTEPIHCPACREPMSQQDFARITVDHCLAGCRGIWFDGGELQKLDHKLKGMSPSLREALSDPRPSEPRGPIDCPRCREEMEQLEYEAQATVTVDRCGSCEGIFLDASELAAIRDRPLTGKELSRSRIRKRSRTGRHRRRQAQQHEAFTTQMLLICTLANID